MIDIAKEVRDTRQQLGLTAEELADKLHVHISTIYRWESGETHPSVERYFKLRKLAGEEIPSCTARQ